MIEFCDVQITLTNLFRMNHHRLAKCRSLFDLARKTSGDIVELGAYHGMSTIALAMGSDRVYTVDAYIPRIGHAGEAYGPKDKEIFRRNIEAAGVHPTLLPVFIEEAADEWAGQIDMVFWDTGIENCLSDHFRLWSKFIKKGGLFLIHDTDNYKLGWGDLAIKASKQGWAIENHNPLHGLRRL